jgi:hypothetical protein
MASQGKVEIIVQGKDEASKVLSGIGKSAEDMSKKLANVGKVMMGAGLGIVTALGGAAKAAEDERINVMRLTSVLDNVGVSYDSVSDSLERNIEATTRKTGVADDAQRNALSELIITTGDYQKALDLLPLALDFAAAKQMDVSTSAELIGKVAQGNYGILSRYGIVLDADATAAEALAAMQEKVKGSAEKMASPLDILKTSFDNMKEQIGAAVLPAFTDFVGKATEIIGKITDWAKENPKVVETLLKIGVVLATGGAILMGISSLSRAIISVNAALTIMKALSGPSGWAQLAIGAGVAAASIIAMNKLMTDATGEDTSSKRERMAALDADYKSGKISYDDYYEKLSSGNYQHGGTVPGPLGKPVPVIAHGGERFLGTQNSGSGGGVSINVGTLLGDETSLRSFARKVKQIIGEDDRRNAFGGVNSGYYFGRSSV